MTVNPAQADRSRSTAEQPWPVRTVARKIAEWIHRLGQVWVEGQVTQISAKQGNKTAFLTLRDPAADISLTVTCPIGLLHDVRPPVRDGARIVVHARPNFYVGRGTISLRATEIRSVGIGELLAR
ncbi:MAG: exodeoxyribonuclease VII large subunit, partial [Thermocrispum sp.]